MTAGRAIATAALLGSAFLIAEAALASTQLRCGYEEEGVPAANWTALIMTSVDLRCESADGKSYEIHVGGIQLGAEGATGQATVIWCSGSDPRGTYWGLPVIGNSSVSALVTGLHIGLGYMGSSGTCTLGAVKFGGVGATAGLLPILTIR